MRDFLRYLHRGRERLRLRLPVYPPGVGVESFCATAITNTMMTAIPLTTRIRKPLLLSQAFPNSPIRVLLSARERFKGQMLTQNLGLTPRVLPPPFRYCLLQLNQLKRKRRGCSILYFLNLQRFGIVDDSETALAGKLLPWLSGL